MLYIADPGCNFTSTQNLKEIATHCKEAGATHFKPQLFDAYKLYQEEGNPYFEQQVKCSLTYKQAEEIVKHCCSIDITPLFSPFDVERVQWCKDLGLKQIKVAARMAGNKEFLEKIAECKLFPIISFSFQHRRLPQSLYYNMFNYNYELYKTQFTKLFSVSKYPAEYDDYVDQFNTGARPDGISDHTQDIYLAIGACVFLSDLFVIEKHVYLNEVPESPDMVCSISTEQLKSMILVCSAIREK